MPNASNEHAASPAVPPRPPMRAIGLLAFAAFASAANIRVTDTLLPLIAREFTVTIGAAAATVAAFTIAYGLCQTFYGAIGDRRGKYQVIAVATLAASLITALSAAAPSIEMLTIARFATGAATAAIIPLSLAWIGDVVRYEQRQAVLAQFLTGTLTGFTFGQAGGGFLGAEIGWRGALVVLSAIYLLAAAALVWELMRNPLTRVRHGAGQTTFSQTIRQSIGLLKRPWIRVVVVTVFFEGMAMYAAFAFIGADLHQRFGIGFGTVGLTLAAFGIGGLIYALSARLLVPRLGERGLAGIGGVIIACAYLALAATPVLGAVPFIMVLIGLGFYMLHNTLQTNATQMAPEARGAGVSLFALALFLGQAVGVALAASVIDQVGAKPVYITAALTLPVIAFWFRARLKQRR